MRALSFTFPLLLGLLGGCAGVVPTKNTSPLPFTLSPAYESLRGENRLRWTEVKDLNEAAAHAYVEGRAAALNDFLEPDIDPYTGKASIAEQCLKRNLPKPIDQKSERETVKALSLYSSANFVLGSCPDVGAVKTQYSFLYCHTKKSLYLVSAFLPAGAAWPDKPVVRCE